jgi:hypothetical protein
LGERLGNLYTPAPFSEEALNPCVSEKTSVRIKKLIKTAAAARRGAKFVKGEIARGILAEDEDAARLKHRALCELYFTAERTAVTLEVSAENVCACCARLKDALLAAQYARMEFIVGEVENGYEETGKTFLSGSGAYAGQSSF